MKLHLPSTMYLVSGDTEPQIRAKQIQYLTYYRAMRSDCQLGKFEKIKYDRYGMKTRYSLLISTYLGWKVSCLHAGYMGSIPEYEENPELAIYTKETPKPIEIPIELRAAYDTAIKADTAEAWDRLHLACCCFTGTSDEVAYAHKLSVLAMEMQRGILLSQAFNQPVSPQEDDESLLSIAPPQQP